MIKRGPVGDKANGENARKVNQGRSKIREVGVTDAQSPWLGQEQSVHGRRSRTVSAAWKRIP